MNTNWKQAQKWEKSWWGSCVNTYREETKQLTYANRMDLPISKYTIDANSKSIIDIGGGCVSLLLKTINADRKIVVDPLEYPHWTIERYAAANVSVWKCAGEEVYEMAEIQNESLFDEAWIYNCLQHTYNPEKIIEDAKSVANTIRIFEWIDIEPNIGHPQKLSEELLNEWLDGEGTIEYLDQKGCQGLSYYGVFRYE